MAVAKVAKHIQRDRVQLLLMKEGVPSVRGKWRNNIEAEKHVGRENAPQMRSSYKARWTHFAY